MNADPPRTFAFLSANITTEKIYDANFSTKQ
jgi:hypothetical protein